jgi:hypothetical protein
MRKTLLEPLPATITEIIDAGGDQAGNGLQTPFYLAVDSNDNVYVTGIATDNVFRITPGRTITEIIDAGSDQAGNGVANPGTLGVDSNDNVYVASGGIFVRSKLFRVPTVAVCP